MLKSASFLLPSLRRRSLCTASSDKIVAAVLFERLPVVIPKIDPVVYAFQEFSLRWRQQYSRKYPDEVLAKADAKGKADYHQIDFEPAPRITEADKINDRKLLQRALDRRLYLLLNGPSYVSPEKPVWHFPEKIYESEETLRQCAESALKSVLGDLQYTYFVGNAPFAHMSVESAEALPNLSSFQRFFFKSQVVGTNKLRIGKCDDHVWVTKDELMEYFPDQAAFLNQMIIS